MPYAFSQPIGAPRLARTNPLLRGMRHSWGTNVAGPRVAFDAVGRANGAFGVGIPSTTSGNQWVAGPNGYYLNYDDAGTGTVNSVTMTVGDANGSGSPGSNTFALAFRCRLGALQNGMAIYGSFIGGIEVQISAAGKIELVKQQVAALGASTGAIGAGVDVDIGISYDGSTVSYYINGAPAGSSNSGQMFSLDMQYFLGAAGNGERLPNGSRIYRFDVWSRPLVANEFKAWSNNPWQIYEAANDDDDYLAAATTAVTGALSSALGPAIMAANGTTTNRGVFASSLGGVSMSASGSVATLAPASGAFASTLGGAAMSAAGLATSAGTYASTMTNASMSASGGVAGVPYGTLASTLAGAGMSGSGSVLNRGLFASTLDGAALAAGGTVAPNIIGTFAPTLGGAFMYANGYLGNVAPANPARAYRWRVMRRHFSNPGTQ